MTTPAPPTDRRRERHLAKRATIVAEAWTLARRDGLAAISLRDLADRVGLRQPSLYAYFDSKLALYDAMFADGNRQLIETVSALPEHDDPHEALVDLVEELTRFSAADTVRHQLLFQRTIPGFEPSEQSYAVAREFYAIGQERLAAPQRAQRDGNEIVFVPGPEEGAGANHESVRMAVEHQLLGARLAHAIDVERPDRIGLDVRTVLLPVEHEVRGKGHQR